MPIIIFNSNTKFYLNQIKFLPRIVLKGSECTMGTQNMIELLILQITSWNKAITYYIINRKVMGCVLGSVTGLPRL